jgi:hypothetical protein
MTKAGRRMNNGFDNSFLSSFKFNKEDYGGNEPNEEIKNGSEGEKENTPVPETVSDVPPVEAVPLDNNEPAPEYERELHTVGQKTSTSCDLESVSEMIKRQLEEKSEVPVEETEDGKTVFFKDEPTYVYSREPDEDAAQKIGVFIDDLKLVFEEYKDLLESRENGEQAVPIQEKAVRTYDEKIKEIENKMKAVPYDSDEYRSLKKEMRDKIKDKMGLSKVTFAKPKEEKPFSRKLKMAAIVDMIISGFFGIQANSYFNYCVANRKKAPSGFGAAFGWLTESDMPTALDPFNSEIFISAFGMIFVIVAIVMLLAYSSADTKKRSRVGHEHGAARLGTSTDFKKFKSRFME